MAQKEQVEHLRNICRTCIETSVDDLVAKSAWGSINFEDARPQLELAYSLYRDLLRLPINILPESTINTVVSSAEVLLNVLAEVHGFDITQGVPSRRRNEIVSHISSATDTFFAQVQPWITYLAYSHGDLETNARELSDTVKQAKITLGKLEKEAQEKKDEVDQIVTATREAAAETGVAHFTQDFQKEAENLQSSATKWLWATAVLVIFTIVTAYFLFKIEKPSDWFSVVHQTTTRLIILGTLITATVWCGRIYKAFKHQVVTNKHRANAIKTFQAFVQAASSDTVRDSVLLETTRAIFSPRPSGYLDREPTSGEYDQTRIIKAPNRSPNTSE